MKSDLARCISRFYEQVGQKVRNARAHEGVTQSQLADAVGLTRTSITNLEAGRQHIPLHLLARIAAVLKTRTGDLLPEVSVFDDLIVMPDLTKSLAGADEGMRSFVESTVAKVAIASRRGGAT